MFRKNLGLKPGQKVTKEQLTKMVKDKGLENEIFYRAFDDANIANAINKVAVTPTRTRNTSLIDRYV